MDPPGAPKPVHVVGDKPSSDEPVLPRVDFGNKLTRDEISALSPKQIATLLKLNQHIEKNDEGQL